MQTKLDISIIALYWNYHDLKDHLFSKRLMQNLNLDNNYMLHLY